MTQPVTQPVTTPEGVIVGATPASASSTITHPAHQAPAFVPPPAVDPDKVFTKEDLENARREEKDKLYGRLDSLGSQLSILTSERESRLSEEEAAQQAAEAEAQRQREAQETLVERFERQQAELKAQLEQERQAREFLEVSLQKEREFADLEAYKARAVAAASDDILPELVDYVVGNTPQEIDISVAGLVERSNLILANTSEALSQHRQTLPGPRVTAPPVGPLETQSPTPGEPTVEELRAMSMSEFGARRREFGVQGSSNNRGLFG